MDHNMRLIKGKAYYLTQQNENYLDILARIAGTSRSSVLNKILDQKRAADAPMLDTFEIIRASACFSEEDPFIPDVPSPKRTSRRYRGPYEEEFLDKFVNEIYEDEHERRAKKEETEEDLFGRYLPTADLRDGFVNGTRL